MTSVPPGVVERARRAADLAAEAEPRRGYRSEVRLARAIEYAFAAGLARNPAYREGLLDAAALADRAASRQDDATIRLALTDLSADLRSMAAAREVSP